MNTTTHSNKTTAKALHVLRRICQRLTSSGIEDAQLEAELILHFVTGIKKIDLYNKNPELSENSLKTIDNIVNKRVERLPLQYILRNVEFLNLRIAVGPGVLIPRPETELLVLEVVNLFEEHLLPDKADILDIGTGSGCIGLAIAQMIPTCYVTGVDISAKAIDYATKNKKLNNIENFKALTGNLFEPVKGRTFDLIVSNPPYIKRDEIASLQEEVSRYEPRIALDGGMDGLNFYRMIIPQSVSYLKNKGFLAFEIGLGQLKAVVDIAKKEGFIPFRIKKDFSSIDRILILRRG